MKAHSFGLTLCMLGASVFAADYFETAFTPGNWRESDWIMVKSSRWPYRGRWIQENGFIANAVPQDATPRELESKRAGETYTSMILNRAFSGNAAISCTMDFDHRMAPGLIIAEEPVKTEAGAEYRNHYEIILFDRGINVWRHYFEDGRQKWVRKAFLTAPFKPGTPYELSVKIQFDGRGPQMILQAGGHTFGFHDGNIPRNYRVGIVAGEGINRFYDFKASAPARP